MSKSTIPSKRPASDAQEAAWVADEDRFVLQQARTKAAIRIKGGRAQPIDWLAVTLAVVDPERNPLDELDMGELELRDLEAVFDDLDNSQLQELEKGVDTYLALEKSRSNHEYWAIMKTICKDRRQQFKSAQPSARGVNSVASDLDKLLAPKSLDQLEKLEKQIQSKLSSNEPIDTDYWEHLLKSLLTYKAKAKLRKVTESIANSRLGRLRKQQAAEAAAFKVRTEAKLRSLEDSPPLSKDIPAFGDHRHELDPEPMLKLRPEDKTLETVDASEFRQRLSRDREKVLRQGYVTSRPSAHSGEALAPSAKRARTDAGEPSGNGTRATAFDREAARGLGADEEIFTEEEEVMTKNKTQWADQYRPRKPRYFNRVQTGYEWNKYNQTHYDQDNPPPKVVQGYKFNIFYPDLVDKTKAPTFKIEREGGRKRGQSFAPAGEDDTCLIRFTAGPPYEDIAFRIVDKEWDYSAKRERGFKSSFDKGILQLHFQFKKIYYRK